MSTARKYNYFVLRLISPVCFLLTLWLFVGCSKEEENAPAQAEYLSPSSGESFYLPDTVTVTARISDADGIEQVRIELKTNAGDKVADLFQQAVDNQNEILLNTALYLELPDVSSGTYQLAVRVYDGERWAQEFREVQIFQQPLALRYWFAATGNPDQTKIYRGGPMSTAVEQIHTVQDFCGMAALSRYHQIAFAGNFTYGFRAFADSAFVIQGQLPSFHSGGSPWFVALNKASNSPNLLLALEDGRLQTINQSQEVILTSQDNLEHRPVRFWGFTERTVMLTRAEGTGQVRLVFFTTGTGAFHSSLLLGTNVDVLAVDERNGSEYALIVNNSDGTCSYSLLSYGSQSLEQLYTFNAPGLSACTLPNSRFAVAVQNELYRIGGNSGPQVLSNSTFSCLVYNEADATLIGGSNNSIIEIDLSSLQTAILAQFNEPVREIDLVYNR